MENSSTLSVNEPFQIRVEGRVIGEVLKGIFKKTITGSLHFLKKPPAIALSVESLAQAERAGAVEIHITDRETGRVYACTFEHFKNRAFPIQRGRFEPQLALLLSDFDISSPLELSSHAPRRGEVKRKPGSGTRVRNPRGLPLVSPRQLVFKGMI